MHQNALVHFLWWTDKLRSTGMSQMLAPKAVGAGKEFSLYPLSDIPPANIFELCLQFLLCC